MILLVSVGHGRCKSWFSGLRPRLSRCAGATSSNPRPQHGISFPSPRMRTLFRGGVAAQIRRVRASSKGRHEGTSQRVACSARVHGSGKCLFARQRCVWSSSARAVVSCSYTGFRQRGDRKSCNNATGDRGRNENNDLENGLGHHSVAVDPPSRSCERQVRETTIIALLATTPW